MDRPIKNFLRSSFRYFSGLLVVGLFFVSCSTPRPEGGKTEAEVLYKEAQDFAKKERYLLAIEKINAIKSQYPYSYYATHAELLHADILFMQESFVEAAAAYIMFKDLHPKHEKMNHVLWRLAESYFYQLPSTFDRDLSPAEEATKYYQEVIQLFPGSDYEKNATEKIRLISEMLMKKDLYIADFYFKTEVFDSARLRYLDILEKYQDASSRDHAMVRVVESSLQLKEFPECEKYANQFLEKVSKDLQRKLRGFQEECQKQIPK